jgi:hypothetical protein
VLRPPVASRGAPPGRRRVAVAARPTIRVSSGRPHDPCDRYKLTDRDIIFIIGRCGRSLKTGRNVLGCPLFGTLSSELFGTLHAIASTARRGVATVAVDESETAAFLSTTRKRAKNTVILGVAPETCPPASETLNPSQRPTKQAAGDDSISLGVLALLRIVDFYTPAARRGVIFRSRLGPEVAKLSPGAIWPSLSWTFPITRLGASRRAGRSPCFCRASHQELSRRRLNSGKFRAASANQSTRRKCQSANGLRSGGTS